MLVPQLPNRTSDHSFVLQGGQRCCAVYNSSSWLDELDGLATENNGDDRSIQIPLKINGLRKQNRIF